MYLKTFVDEKLAQNAYLVGCQRTGEAIIIDPPRYYEHIIADAAKEGLTNTAAAETHIHADYVSGAHQLAVKENVKLYLRSEEHTSELQSRFDLVCRLLLEKKKKQIFRFIYISS